MAILNASSPVWVVSIDGKKVSRTGITGHKHFRVSPGLHSVVVQYSQLSLPFQESSGSMTYSFQDRAFSVQNVPIRFFATSGATYYVKAGRSEDHWKPTITDIPEPTVH